MDKCRIVIKTINYNNQVRRVQLENLLNAEKEQYREELNNMGLTLYKERW